MGWVIPLGYVAVWLLYGWRLTIHLLDAEVRRNLREYPSLYNEYNGGAARVATEERGSYLFAGFGLALFWPVVAPVRGAYRLLGGEGLFSTPTEREEAGRRELEELRKLARENGLPMPNYDREKGAA